MKKMISLLLIVCMACMLIPATAEGGDLLGDWYGTMYGMAIQLTFSEDGTYTLKMISAGQEMPGKYELKDGIVYMDGNEDAASGFVFDGSSLVNETQGVTLTREAVEVEAITLAEVDPEAPLEAFAGEWTCKYLSMSGIVMDVSQVPLEQLGATGLPTLKIEGTSVEIGGLELGSAATMPFKYEDGALVLDLGETLSGSGLENMLKFNVLQDGSIAMTVSMGQEMVFCFVPTAAEEAPAA